MRIFIPKYTVMIAILIAVSSCTPPVSDVLGKKELVRPGMTYSEVVRALGGEPARSYDREVTAIYCSDSKCRGITRVEGTICEWRYSNGLVSVSFDQENVGKVIAVDDAGIPPPYKSRRSQDASELEVSDCW